MPRRIGLDRTRSPGPERTPPSRDGTANRLPDTDEGRLDAKGLERLTRPPRGLETSERRVLPRHRIVRSERRRLAQRSGDGSAPPGGSACHVMRKGDVRRGPVGGRCVLVESYEARVACGCWLADDATGAASQNRREGPLLTGNSQGVRPTASATSYEAERRRGGRCSVLPLRVVCVGRGEGAPGLASGASSDFSS